MPVRVAIIKKTEDKHWKGCEEKGTLTLYEDIEWRSHCGI
jgi:hypothetical protein